MQPLDFMKSMKIGKKYMQYQNDVDAQLLNLHLVHFWENKCLKTFQKREIALRY